MNKEGTQLSKNERGIMRFIEARGALSPDRFVDGGTIEDAIREETGIKASTVGRMLRVLHEYGWLERVEAPNGHHHVRYRLKQGQQQLFGIKPQETKRTLTYG
jgi:DNA-binding MarR family transcriptional regulator